MAASIIVAMVEIPKTLSIHNVERMKKGIEKFSDNVLDIIYNSLSEKAIELLSPEELCEKLTEEHLFSLDEGSKIDITRRLSVRVFMERAVDEIITPFLTGEPTSKGARVIYKKIGTVHYAISFQEDYGYRSEADYAMIKALKVSNILTRKF